MSVWAGLLQAGELSLTVVTFCPFLGFLLVDEQSVHFEANCHRGRLVKVDQTVSGPSVQVELSLGYSVGGSSIKVSLTIPRDY
jgi:hypothetical protein